MNSAVVQSKGVTFEVSVAGVDKVDTVEQRVTLIAERSKKKMITVC